MTTPTPESKQSRSEQDTKKTGAAKSANDQNAEIAGVIESDPTGSALDGDATVVKVEDGVTPVAYDEGEGVTMVTIKGDMLEEFYFPDTRRPSYRLLYHAGQVVPKSVVDAYNADVERAKVLADNGGVDPENPAGIDSTTIASGTRVKLEN